MIFTDVTFNTGRRYSSEGQIIRAVFDAEYEVIRFQDFSRMITGAIRCSSINAFRSEHGLAERVMRAYDHNEYESTGTSAAPEWDETAEMHRLNF